MPKNLWDVKIPVKSYGFAPFKKKTRRSLGIRDKQILYRKAKGKCEACEKRIDYDEMQVGHIRAYSKGGATTLANSACLCYRCNKLQGTGGLVSLKKKLAGTYGKRAKTLKKTNSKKASQKENYWFDRAMGKKMRYKSLF